MLSSAERITRLHTLPIKVWVLAPQLVTTDANLDYYYDFSQSIAEYTRVFEELHLDWQWQPVTTDNYSDIVAAILAEKNKGQVMPVVLNLCDGDEVNGTPGISVVRSLEKNGLVYTGSDEHFYHITTSKIPMKQAFDSAGVSTPAWEAIRDPDQDLSGIFERLGSPIILKPAVSGGSMGVGTRNVVHTEQELQQQLQQMFAGYRGWNLAVDGIIAEAFIQGAEFTTMILGSAVFPGHSYVLTPVQRVFHASLPETEKFLSFDRLWEIYEDETPMPEQAHFYEYQLPEESLHTSLQEISMAAYKSCGGTGYTRVDIRREDATGQLYVLEVNAQCGLSEDENYTSIGAILRMSGVSFTAIITDIIEDAFRRNKL